MATHSRIILLGLFIGLQQSLQAQSMMPVHVFKKVIRGINKEHIGLNNIKNHEKINSANS